MQSVNYFKDDQAKDDYALILELVTHALKEAKVLDHVTIEERNEGFMVKPKVINNKEDKIKKFEALAGSAIPTGEDVKELLNMAHRTEEWRGNKV